MSDFYRCITFTLQQEGGYQCMKMDRGNWTGGQVGVGVLRGTKYGISAAAYPDIVIKSMTLEVAEGIYERDYWRPTYGDYLPPGVNLMVFDEAVNAGVGRSIKLLQTALNVEADGDIGDHTLDAAKAIPAKDLVGKLGQVQSDFYRQCVSFDLYGGTWLRRVNARMTAAQGMLTDA